MIVIDKETMAAIERYDAMDPTSILKSTPLADLTPGLIASNLGIDEARAELILGMIEGRIADVLTA